MESGLKAFAEKYADFLEKAGAIEDKKMSLDEKMAGAKEGVKKGSSEKEIKEIVQELDL